MCPFPLREKVRMGESPRGPREAIRPNNLRPIPAPFNRHSCAGRNPEGRGQGEAVPNWPIQEPKAMPDISIPAKAGIQGRGECPPATQ